MPQIAVDVTDLVDFLARGVSLSGVQRVAVQTIPLLATQARIELVLFRPQDSTFVPLSACEQEALLEVLNQTVFEEKGVRLRTLAADLLEPSQASTRLAPKRYSALIALGALWMNESLMSAVRKVHVEGTAVIPLLFDLTPVSGGSHTARMSQLFERYLTLLQQTASRVPAISSSSRLDFERYLLKSLDSVPLGEVTRLPCGLVPQVVGHELNPWARKYALFVGTVEARKNHLLALDGWRALISRHGVQQVPDLVCIGRLGWNSGAFLRHYVRTNGLEGKVSILSSSVGDEELARFYAHAEFTVYPSNYEGWGLPVSESLAFGKVPVVANNSSLPEAGGDLAVYFETGNVDDFVRVIEENVLDLDRRAELEERIRREPPVEVTWEDVANTILREVEAAEWREPLFPEVELGREYMLAMGPLPPDESHADRYMDYLVREGLTPMLRQPRGERDYVIADPAVIGTFGTPQEWGNEIRPGRYAEFRITRPVEGPLVILVSTRAMPGKATIEVAGPGGPMIEDVYLGSVITIRLGDGKAGEHAMAIMTVTDAHDSIEGFLGIRSFVVLEESNKDSRILALEAAAEALRQELDFIQGTRSWKITAPLRKWKGRGA